MDLLNYKTSFLNPALKLLVPCLFLLGTFFVYRARNQYQGELGKVVRRLVIAGAAGFLATFFRYGADIWFTNLKWGESLMFFLFAVASIHAAWPLLTFMRRMDDLHRRRPAEPAGD